MVSYHERDCHAQNLAELPLFEFIAQRNKEARLRKQHSQLIHRYCLSPYMAAAIADNLFTGGGNG